MVEVSNDSTVVFVGGLLLLNLQIAKILAAKSVDGLAPSSIYSDLIIYIVNAVYHIVSGSPFR